MVFCVKLDDRWRPPVLEWYGLLRSWNLLMGFAVGLIMEEATNADIVDCCRLLVVECWLLLQL